MNTESQVLNVPIEDIIPNRFQPRLNFDESSLKELSASIKEHGIIQPLVLRKLNEKYEIIAGERRYKAAKMAGMTTVPAIISNMDDRKSAEVAIVENVQRKDLSSIEEAKSYRALLDKGYLTQEELAKKMGLSQSAISNKLRLLSLSENVQNAIMEGKISERHARSLLVLDDVLEQEKWLKTIIDERLTVKELDRRLKESTKKQEIKIEKEEKGDDIPLIDIVPNINDIKEKATDIIGPNKNTNIGNENKNENIDTTDSSIIPNKFFNFLEDESANMNTSSITEEEKQVDDVEMLDFDVSITPSSTPNNDTKDMSNALNILNKLEEDLKNNNYTVSILKDETEKELKYTITINKE